MTQPTSAATEAIELKPMMMMRVYSGKCRQSDVGMPTGIKCLGGEQLYTGDIVVLLHQTEWSNEPSCCSLTVVTSDQWQSYTDGTHTQKADPLHFFVMGVAKVPLNESEEWMVARVKSYRDVIDGEHWTEYGFNYKLEAA